MSSTTPAKPSSVRERLVDAAFDLFEERGFEQTTVDDLAELAGVGRSTFFRHFRTKEDVVLADHDRMLAVVQGHLGVEASGRAALAARVAAAARSVLEHYVSEGERARRRYRLSAKVPAIRAREVVGMRSYQRAFRRALHEGFGGGAEQSLESGLAANAVITATHHVLRRWLRGETQTPYDDYDRAIAVALAPWLPVAGAPQAPHLELLATARRATSLLEQLLGELRSLDPGTSP